MPTYLRPGVYMEEIAPPRLRRTRPYAPTPWDALEPSRRPEWRFEHSTAAFLGVTPSGPLQTPIFVTSFEQFEYTFYPFDESDRPSYLADAVYGFFLNGGRECWIVRVAESLETLTVRDVLGDAESRSGLEGLTVIDDVSTVCVPDLGAAYQAQALDLAGMNQLQLSVIVHCETMGQRIAILDAPPDFTPQEVLELRRSWGYNSQFAALYYPWLRAVRPPSSTVGLVPPCGHVAGVFARTDLLRGPQHAPANTPIEGATGLERYLQWSEHDVLSHADINALVASPGRGILVFGGRTLSHDSAQRRIRTRRLLNFIRKNVVLGTSWAAFEPHHDERVWARIAADLDDLLSLLWRSGALQGDTPDDAYSVRCDAETNPPETQSAGQIIAECTVSPEPDLQLPFRVVYVSD